MFTIIQISRLSAPASDTAEAQCPSGNNKTREYFSASSRAFSVCSAADSHNPLRHAGIHSCRYSSWITGAWSEERTVRLPLRTLI